VTAAPDPGLGVLKIVRVGHDGEKALIATHATGLPPEK
jgi:hypothetical protein